MYSAKQAKEKRGEALKSGVIVPYLRRRSVYCWRIYWCENFTMKLKRNNELSDWKTKEKPMEQLKSNKEEKKKPCWHQSES